MPTDSRVQAEFSRIWVWGIVSEFSEAVFGTLRRVSRFQSNLTIFTGAYMAPRRRAIMGGLTHVRNRAPVIGGSFAMWGGCFSSIDCLMMWYR